FRLEPLRGAPRIPLPLAVQLAPHLLGAVDLEVRLPHSPDLTAQPLIPLRARRAASRVSLAGLVLVVRRRSDRQLLADRLDSVLPAVLVDEAHHHFARRSSSAWAKYADAFFRISFARRSSLFSRSSSLSRCRSSVVSPGRRP